MEAIEQLENRTLLSAAISQADQETLLGIFGVVNGKSTKLKISLDPKHSATFTLSKGTATAFQSGGDIDLEITSGVNLNVAVTHGATVNFSTVNITGNLRTFSAPAGELVGTLTASGVVGSVTIGNVAGVANFAAGVAKFTGGDLAGTLSVAGNVANLKVGNVSGNVNVAGSISNLTAKAVSGTIFAAGVLTAAKVAGLTGQIVAASEIKSLSATSMTNATVLAGANLGSDGLLGGTGSATDTFGAGTIDKFSVTHAITASFIGAGVDPFDGVFGNGNDISAGTGLIKTISAKSADSASRFESSAFGIAKLPKKVIGLTFDPRFIVL